MRKNKVIGDLCVKSKAAGTLHTRVRITFPGYKRLITGRALVKILEGAALVADEANFIGMEEVVAKAYKNFLILQFDPCDLINDLVAPLVQALVAYLDVAGQHPEEAEAAFLKFFYLEVHYFSVAHCVVV